MIPKKNELCDMEFLLMTNVVMRDTPQFLY